MSLSIMRSSIRCFRSNIRSSFSLLELLCSASISNTLMDRPCMQYIKYPSIVTYCTRKVKVHNSDSSPGCLSLGRGSLLCATRRPCWLGVPNRTHLCQTVSCAGDSSHCLPLAVSPSEISSPTQRENSFVMVYSIMYTCMYIRIHLFSLHCAYLRKGWCSSRGSSRRAGLLRHTTSATDTRCWCPKFHASVGH